MSRSRWLSQFTPEEYGRLVALATLEPVGVDRIYLYLSILCSAATGGEVPVRDLLFRHVTPQQRHAEFLAALATNPRVIVKD